MHPFQAAYALDANHPEGCFFSEGLYGPCADGRVPYVPTRRAYVSSVDIKAGYCKCMASLGPCTKVAHDFLSYS